MTTSEPTITRAARRIEAEWRTGPDTFTILSVSHSTTARSFVASVRRERAGTEVGDITSRTYAPFQDMERIAIQRVGRFGPKALEAFFQKQLAVVVAAKDDPSTTIGDMFLNPTTA